MENFPFVSVIIPCKNEEKFIGKCLDSLLSNNYPSNLIEIIVVDGMSKDGSRDIVKEYCGHHKIIRSFNNNKEKTPYALNIGINNAKGEVIVRADAHAVYDKNYISNCVKHLYQSGADNVGGVVVTLAGADSLFAKSIAIAYGHPFAVGNSFFRIGVKNHMSVDTVFGGCYKSSLFKKIGLFNENLSRSQDMELSIRIKKNGGVIMLFPDIKSRYFAKSRLIDFFVHNFKDGIWSIYPLKFVKTPLKLRHYVPLAFVSLLLLSLVFSFILKQFLYLFFAISLFYLIFVLFFSIEVAAKKRNVAYLFAMPTVFMARHFGYGFGSLVGCLKLFV